MRRVGRACRTAVRVTIVACGPALPHIAWAQAVPDSGGPEPFGNLGRAATVMPNVDVVASTPLLGTGISRDLVPAQTQVFTPKDIAREGLPNALQTLQDQAAGVNLDLASGNPYQPTLFYHGFEASPLQGTPQGMAVYVNGVRFNQAFGDTVNWDLIPDIAIERMNLEGSNPVYGLNALGGSLNVQMKNGFIYHGAEADLSGGSFGQIQGQFQYGVQVGDVSTYVAGNAMREEGWRDLQSSNIYDFFGDVGWRGDSAELHLDITAASTKLNGPGTSPVELLAADEAAQFTGPNAINNQHFQGNLNGTYDLNDSTSFQALAYYNYFLQRVMNGNAPNNTPCSDGSGLLCQESGAYSTTLGGAFIPAYLGSSPYAYSELDNQTTNTNAYGASAQVTNTDPIFGLDNHFVAGFSFDGAQTEFTGESFVGGITPYTRVYVGPGYVIDEPGVNSPVRVGISDAYYGVFATDTLKLTPRLALTLAGRFNAAQIDLSDQNGGDLSGNHSYTHFNPSAGLTYKVIPWLSVYGSYSEANRAPTPAELSCASPADSCSLANFFVGDPNLKQVVAHTWEAGLRGSFAPLEGGRLTYSVGFYHTVLNDDIAFVNSVTLNRAYFTNIGQTLRQGVDAGLQFTSSRWSVYMNYSYIDATYQSGFVQPAGNNPLANANGNLVVMPGNRLPGIPSNIGKLGVQYKPTEAWTIGATLVGQSSTFLFGDPSNLNPRLPAYYVVNFNTSYQITPHLQIFGLVRNLTNQGYYTYGTFSPTTAVFLAQAPYATNPRSYSPAAPIGGFGGVRVTF